MRRAVSLLQQTVTVFGAAATPEQCDEIAGVIPHEVVVGFAVTATESADFATMQRGVAKVIAAGIPAQALLVRVLDWVLSSEGGGRVFSDVAAGQVAEALAEADLCVRYSSAARGACA